jgi:hypothetical protein
LLLSDLLRKKFLRITANSIASRMTGVFSAVTHRLTSKIVSHCPVKSPALTELRREHAGTAAVTQFVNLIKFVFAVKRR